MICLPGAAPRCDACPLKEKCEAHRLKREADFPVKMVKAEKRREKLTVFVLELDGKFSDLEIRSVDGVSFAGRYPDKTLELHLDYYGRAPRREIELYTADDVVVCDFIKAEIRFLKSDRRIDLAEERNAYCLREIGYFFDFALNGARNINSIPYANGIIDFVLSN